jgi:hypothetical protein
LAFVYDERSAANHFRSLHVYSIGSIRSSFGNFRNIKQGKQQQPTYLNQPSTINKFTVMPLPPKSLRLAAPLKEFKIPTVSWRPDPKQFKEFQKNSRVTYTHPDQIEIKGRVWLRVPAYDAKNLLLGAFLLPVKYYTLWRRLVYGALFQENMYEAWINRTKGLKGKKGLNDVEKEEINLKNMAGTRLVQYLLCRRVVLEELMKLKFDSDPPPEVHSLIEFGIRDSRDWLFESFENAKEQGQKYLYLDPTLQKNKREFGAS